jgi:hypothetical protein
MFEDDFFSGSDDYDMAELEARGNLIARLRKQGICLHTFTREKRPGVYTCLDCNKEVTDQEIEALEIKYL